ncbi:ankyrin repeat-containing protein [Tieghemostelium lacteum]|uniref:Ankyrin repeat-containing protein n=1 Tax=Tieghemostelium lacteum TaxID=361077 RepID=A0A151Z5C7_TIELA|nr:ankyrin repeat-containing protein [Tieghemostelium lacteum]|eukprot:KYQ89166.1 ankyrin repeat-containing protein [Tieghemostelium lacteum]
MSESTPQQQQATTTTITPTTTTTTVVTGNTITTTVNNGTVTTNSGSTTTTVPIATNTTSTTQPITITHNAQISGSSNNLGSTTLVVTPSSPSSIQKGTHGNQNNISVSLTIPNLATSTSSTGTPQQLNTTKDPTTNTHQEYQQAMENKKTLKKILKSSKHWSDSMKVYTQNSNIFSEELIKHSEHMNKPKDSHLSSSLVSFGNTLKAVNIVHDQLYNEVQDLFYTPLNNFVDYDFAEAVESNKRVTKCKEDYEMSLGKIQSTIKKSKTGIDEQKLFNYEQELEKLKDIYESSNKELDYKLQELSHKNETKYLKSLLLFINSQYTFYTRASKLFGNLKPKLEDIERYLEEIQPPKVVEGHLMKKSKQVMGGWNKCWWVLKDGMLFCYKGKKEYHPENALNILLCSVRVPQTAVILSSPSTNQPSLATSVSSKQLEKEKDKDKEKDSQNDNLRFEILHPRKKQPIVLQAESEEERDRWVQAIQDAISNSLNCQTLPLEKSASGLTGGGGGNSLILGKAMSNTSVNGQPGGQGSVQTDEVNQQVLRILQKVPGNNICADCGSPDPDWAAINLGILICKVCSGVHRSLGTHISKVRSLTLDKWSPENTLFMKEVGNNRFNLLYEHHLSEQVRPTEKSDRMAKETWIKAKYKTKDFIIRSSLPQEEIGKILFDMIAQGQRDIIRYLKVLSQGADLNQLGEGGRTPLHQSILKSDDVTVPELLLQNGADVTIGDTRGWTPMHYAAYFNRPRCAYLLMRRGFESVRNKCRDHLGRLALDLAVINRSRETEQVLRGEELDSGLTMDSIENNTIPIFAASVPLNSDLPTIQNQEILSDDDEDLDDQEHIQEIEDVQSWPSENESNGRASFSGPESFINLTDNLKVLNSSHSNSSLISTNSNNNSSSNLGNLIAINGGGGEPISSLNSSRDNNRDSINSGITSTTTTTTTTNSSGTTGSTVEIGNRPKSNRRPSILGRGKNTLRAMKSKLNMSQQKNQSSDGTQSQLAQDQTAEDLDEEDDDEEFNDQASVKDSTSSSPLDQSQSGIVHKPIKTSKEGEMKSESSDQDSDNNQTNSNKKASSPNKSPTPFKHFLKKLKIKKVKKVGGQAGSPQLPPEVQDTESYIDVPDNISIGTNDDSSLISDQESTISDYYTQTLHNANNNNGTTASSSTSSATTTTNKEKKDKKDKKEKEKKDKKEKKEREKEKEKKKLEQQASIATTSNH